MIWIGAGLLWTALIVGILLIGSFSNSSTVTSLVSVVLAVFSILAPVTVAWLSTRRPGPREESDVSMQALDSIRHYRHDWMNRLQVLFAYIKLQKSDMIDSAVQSMLTRSEWEQSVVQVGVPELSLFLLTNSGWGREGRDITLDCERLTAHDRLPVDGNAVTQFVKQALGPESQHEEKIFISIRETNDGLNVTVRSSRAGAQSETATFRYL
jgi:hypothetical protein